MLRDVAIVAGYELGESLRSRRVLVFALLYVGSAIAGSLLFIQILRGFEEVLAGTLAVAHTQRPGAVTEAVMRSAQARDFLTRLFGDRELASELIAIPPLALFYGWMTVGFCPLLVVSTASECFASELASGAIRFSLVRADRLSYSLGKLVGQSALLGVSIFAGGVAVWITGYFELSDFSLLESALWLARLSARGFVYCLAYVGLAVGLSHLTRSVALARVLGLAGLAGTSVVWGVTHLRWSEEHLGWLVRPLRLVVPQAHMLDLFRPQLGPRLAALVMLWALGVVYFAAGCRWRMRKDV